MSERWKPEEYVAGFRDVVDLYLTFLPYMIQWTKIEGSTFLEIGCGSGKWSALFACLGFRCALVDNTPGMFDRVRKNFPMISKTFFFIDDDALDLENTPIEMFDIVFSEGLYEHFLEKGDRLKFAMNTYKSMKGGGTAIIMVPFKTGEEDEYQFESTEEMIDEWLQVFEKVRGFRFDSETEATKFIGIIAIKRDKE